MAQSAVGGAHRGMKRGRRESKVRDGVQQTKTIVSVWGIERPDCDGSVYGRAVGMITRWPQDLTKPFASLPPSLSMAPFPVLWDANANWNVKVAWPIYRPSASIPPLTFSQSFSLVCYFSFSLTVCSRHLYTFFPFSPVHLDYFHRPIDPANCF